MNTVPIKNQCPKCAAPLPDDAPQGLCPKCLLLAASTPTETGAGPAGPANVPALASVQAAFPQLEVIELIGAGGMGAVFKARQPKLDRFVALKLLAPSLAASPAFAERFNREARVLARLSHPGIVSVFDFGQADGFFFLLMEFVDGVNLRQAMQAGRFTPAQALALVPKICEALQFAHDEGILHRDIKPENILLDTKGRVKIADFGIAKLVSEPRPVTKLTATGAAIGTPQYMAPEQLEHPEDVDQRADIYSLGVVFYEMLTGELPIGRFAAPSEKSAVDARVDAVVFRTLEKERERRYGSAGEVKTSVEHLTTAQPVPRAAAPVFDPMKDFILCPPQLPRMAQAIIVYALVVAPALWLLGLFGLEPLPENALVAFVQGAVNVLVVGGEFFFVCLLAIGGWKLRALRRSAGTWLRTVLWLGLALGGLAMAGQLWVEVLASELTPNLVVPHPRLGDGAFLAVGLAALVFHICALVWLRRHRAPLKAICEAAQKPLPPAPTAGTGSGPGNEKLALCYVSTPEHVRSFVGRFIYIYQGKGELRLNSTSLQFTRKWQSVTIPLAAITELSLGHYAPAAKPAKLSFVRVTFNEHGRSRTLLFTPCDSALALAWDTNRVVQEWHDAIQAAVRAGTGLTPPTPADHGLADTRRPAWLLPAMLAVFCVPALLAWVALPLLLHGQLPSFGKGLIGFMAWLMGVALFLLGFWWWSTRRIADREAAPASGGPQPATGFKWWKLLLVLGALALPLGGCLSFAGYFWLRSRSSALPPPPPVAQPSGRAASLSVLAPPREHFIVTGIVFSNGVPVSGRELRAKLWPPSAHAPNHYTVRWQALDAASGVPWEMVVEEQPGGRIAARLRPQDLPAPDWSAVEVAGDTAALKVSRAARTIEVARALQAAGGGNAGAADWSVRVQFQSQPPPPTDSRRGIEADVVLPANQVAVFEVVTRTNGVVVPVPGLAAHIVNGANEPWKGQFLWADDPENLDSLTALPRWSFGLIGDGDRLLETGLGVPTPPANYTACLTFWTELKPDAEIIEGLSSPDPQRPSFGLRIRTQAFQAKPGLRYTGSGFGTNWLKEAASRMAAPER